MKRIILCIATAFYAPFVFGQANTLQNESSRPFILGETITINSQILDEERTLNIFLPDNYDPAGDIRYPVIYLLDGSADEDFIHIVGLVQYNSFEWINRVPKSIVVGIGTVDRIRDFTFPTSIEEDVRAYPTSGHSDKFIDFIKNELQPFIDQNFKTTKSKTIIGQSLGGLLATEILMKYPDLFNTYVIVSPSLWWDNGSLLNHSPATPSPDFNRPTYVYIGVGKEGLTPTGIPRIMEVDANLLAEKIENTKNDAMQVVFDYLPDENHATVMHQAVSNAFVQLNNLKIQAEKR